MMTELDLAPRPFIGQAGQEQDEMSQCGLHRNQLYITNAYKHYTVDNRRPTHDEFEDHRDMLLTEIEMCQPYVIGAVGVESSQYLSWLGHQVFRDMARSTGFHGSSRSRAQINHGPPHPPGCWPPRTTEMGKILWDYGVFGRVLRGEQKVILGTFTECSDW